MQFLPHNSFDVTTFKYIQPGFYNCEEWIYRVFDKGDFIIISPLLKSIAYNLTQTKEYRVVLIKI